jgi:parallel beta-helix repeat protein
MDFKNKEVFMSKRTTAFVLTLACVILSVLDISEANTIYVPSVHQSIQEAIDASNDGDTIIVESGVYDENININKMVNVIGAGADVTSVGRGEDWPKDAVGIISDGIIFSGFFVKGAIHCIGASPTIENNVVINKTRNYAIYAEYNWHNGKKSNPIIQNNFIYGSAYGITLFLSDAIIRNNFIVLNAGYGIHISFFSYPEIENNTIANNGYAGVVNTAYSSPSLKNNIISNNGRYGILNYSNGNEIKHSYNIVSNNQISNYASYQNSSPVTSNATEVNEDPGLVHSPLWTSNGNVLSENAVAIDQGFIPEEEKSIGPFKIGNFIQIGFDDFPRAITKIEGNILSFRPNIKQKSVFNSYFAFVNYLGHNRNLNYDWKLRDDSIAVDSGDPEPSYNDTDGSRNDIGATGGPYSKW